jgi:hypothetical protein
MHKLSIAGLAAALALAWAMPTVAQEKSRDRNKTYSVDRDRSENPFEDTSRRCPTSCKHILHSHRTCTQARWCP